MQCPWSTGFFAPHLTSWRYRAQAAWCVDVSKRSRVVGFGAFTSPLNISSSRTVGSVTQACLHHVRTWGGTVIEADLVSGIFERAQLSNRINFS